jgi:hypothetical protein
MPSIIQLFGDLSLENKARDQILELHRKKRQENKAFCDARAADDAADAERVAAKRVAARAARRALTSASASASAPAPASASAPAPASASAPAPASASAPAHVTASTPAHVTASTSAPVPCSYAVLQSLVAAMSSK